MSQVEDFHKTCQKSAQDYLNLVYLTGNPGSTECPFNSLECCRLNAKYGDPSGDCLRLLSQSFALGSSNTFSTRKCYNLDHTYSLSSCEWLIFALWFSNSYPNDSEKLMLASQTGLTKNQVISWLSSYFPMIQHSSYLNMGNAILFLSGIELVHKCQSSTVEAYDRRNVQRGVCRLFRWLESVHGYQGRCSRSPRRMKFNISFY